jgi:hypothetical protein
MTKKVVLKEYCAEIEMLKSQLQITREKNGSVQCQWEMYYFTVGNLYVHIRAVTSLKSADVKALMSLICA